MNDFSFDHNRVGIVAKGHWADPDVSVSIGFGYAELKGECNVAKDSILGDSEYLFRACPYLVS